MERRCKKCQTLRDLTWYPVREIKGPATVCLACLGRPKAKAKGERPQRKRKRARVRIVPSRLELIAQRARLVRVDPDKARELRARLETP